MQLVGGWRLVGSMAIEDWGIEGEENRDMHDMPCVSSESMSDDLSRLSARLIFFWLTTCTCINESCAIIFMLTRNNDKSHVIPSRRHAGLVDTAHGRVISENWLENIAEMLCEVQNWDLLWHDWAVSDLDSEHAVCGLALAQAHMVPLTWRPIGTEPIVPVSAANSAWVKVVDTCRWTHLRNHWARGRDG